jgi:hypothetical protein
MNLTRHTINGKATMKNPYGFMIVAVEKYEKTIPGGKSPQVK